MVTSYQKKSGKRQRNEVRDALEAYVQEGARKMLVAVLEEEVSAFLGRHRYERGGKLRILAVSDEYSRECLSIKIAPSIPALLVVEVLQWLFLVRGVPQYVWSDNGPELVAKPACQWLKDSGCQTLFVSSGTPW